MQTRWRRQGISGKDLEHFMALFREIGQGRRVLLAYFEHPCTIRGEECADCAEALRQARAAWRGLMEAAHYVDGWLDEQSLSDGQDVHGEHFCTGEEESPIFPRPDKSGR